MDLALLLWMLTVWKGLMLRDCLLSAIPLTWTLSSGDATETGCGAALAVVPMLHKQLWMTSQRTQKQEAKRLTHTTHAESVFEERQTPTGVSNVWKAIQLSHTSTPKWKMLFYWCYTGNIQIYSSVSLLVHHWVFVYLRAAQSGIIRIIMRLLFDFCEVKLIFKCVGSLVINYLS